MAWRCVASARLPSKRLLLYIFRPGEIFGPIFLLYFLLYLQAEIILFHHNVMIYSKFYVAPQVEDLCLMAEDGLLAQSGTGENSTPGTGLWDDED